MKIAVCLKQVPSRDWQPRVNDQKTWVRDQDATFELNEPDAYALEEGLRLKEKHGGEVVVCSVGPARVSQALREALARGADRAIHVEDEALASADAFAVAEALAAAMRDEAFDLVLTGLQSDDQGSAQTGVMLAVAARHRVGDDHHGSRRPGGRRCASSASSRAAGSSGCRCRCPRYSRSRAASISSATRRSRASWPPRRRRSGRWRLLPASRSRQQIVGLYVPEKRKQTQMIGGSPAEAAKALVAALRDEARVIS